MKLLQKHRAPFARVLVTLAILSGPVSAQTWTGTVSSDWNASANWAGGVPSANSAVNIPGNTPFSPSITGTVLIKDLTIGNWSNPTLLSVDGGQLTIKEDLTLVDNASLVMNSGSIHLDRAKNNASFSMGYNNSSLVLHAGSFTSDLDININDSLYTGSADLTFNGNFTVQSNKYAVNGSGGTWTSQGNFNVYGSLFFQNANLISNGSFDVGSGGVVHAGSGSHHYYGSFNVSNNGTYLGENSSSVIYNSTSAKNSALLSVDNGLLEFRGDVDLFSTATIQVTGTGTVRIVGSGEFKQNGNLLIGDGNLEVTGDAVFTQGGTLDISSGSVDISGNATFSHSGTLNIESGSINIDGGAEFNQSGTVNADSATINISGDLTLGSNGSTFNAGSSTINLSGGTFTNSGTFNADSSTVNLTGSTDQAIVGDVTFYNLNVDTDGSLSANGTITVTNDASVDTSASVAPGVNIEVQGDLDDPSNAISAPLPYVRDAYTTSTTSLIIVFSEALTSASAQSTANYLISPTTSVLSATLQADQRSVEITLGTALTEGVTYRAVLNNIISAATGESISTNHTKYFEYEKTITPPSAGPINFEVDSKGVVDAQLSWSLNGNEGALVVLRRGQPVSEVPINQTPYNAGSTWASGSDLGGGQFVVYAGGDSSVTITGLLPKTTYHATVYGFNGGLLNEALYNTKDSATTSFTTGFTLEASIILQGAYLGDGLMNTQLNAMGSLPLSHPFTNDSIFHHSGSESVTSIPNARVVDWVLVDVRRASNPAEASFDQIIASKALFLLEDGQIVDLNGTDNPTFFTDEDGPFVIVVSHRNHMPVFYGDTLSEPVGGTFAIDFSSDVSAWYETQSSFIEDDGTICAATSGLIVNDNTISNSSDDYSQVWSARNRVGSYEKYDVNLDGVINASDRMQIFNARDRQIMLPESAQMNAQGL